MIFRFPPYNANITRIKKTPLKKKKIRLFPSNLGRDIYPQEKRDAPPKEHSDPLNLK